MPRGKYPRKPAAMDSAPHVQVLPQPAAAQEPPSTSRVVASVPASAPAVVAAGRRPHRFADHAKSRNIDLLTFDELRAYGLEVGMTHRDCAELSEPRLRAGCRAHIANHYADLTE